MHGRDDLYGPGRRLLPHTGGPESAIPEKEGREVRARGVRSTQKKRTIEFSIFTKL